MCVSLFQQNEFAKRAKVTVLVALALLFAVESVWTSSRRFLHPPPPLTDRRERTGWQYEKLNPLLSRPLGVYYLRVYTPFHVVSARRI